MRKMKLGSSASFRAAAELGDYEEPEPRIITEWSECPIHGKYPTEDTEIIDDGLRICPLCYIDETNKRKSQDNTGEEDPCETCRYFSYESGNFPCDTCTEENDNYEPIDETKKRT